MMGKIKFNVYMESEGDARYLLESFDNYDDAVGFCQSQNYCYTDENGFVWDLRIIEIYA